MTDEIKINDLEGIAGGATGNRYVIYTVQKGDNLTKLARKFNTTVDEIYRLNRDKIKDKDLIKIGWKLLIPNNN